jgi:hypothetical protein
MMPFNKKGNQSDAVSIPGLTSIDDIHDSCSQDLEPDRTAGRLPAQDEESSPNKRKRSRRQSEKSSNN